MEAGPHFKKHIEVRGFYAELLGGHKKALKKSSPRRLQYLGDVEQCKRPTLLLSLSRIYRSRSMPM